jgi:hypothetical protein
MINTIVIFDLHMINKSTNDNCKSEGFGMQIFEIDSLGVFAKSTKIFTQSFKIFTQTSNLLE